MSIRKDSKTVVHKMDKAKEEVGYDDLLASAGELGLYQWIVFFATAPFYAFGVSVYYSQMLMTEVSPNHWCKIPQLENLTAFERRDLGVPKDDNSKFGYSQCEMYDVNWSEVLITGLQPDRTWNVVPCQYGWEFNKTEIPYDTIGTDLEWVCEKNSYQATAQAIFFIGSIVGGFLFGWVADRFGRVPAIMSSCLAGCIGGFASTFTRNIIEFAVARFVMGLAYDNCMNTAFLLYLEFISPRYRTMMANMSQSIFYTIFATGIPWVALACDHWKTFSLVASLPLGLAVFTKLILPESPTWLLSRGRVDEAIEKVLYIGRINKKEIPVKMIEQFKLSMSTVKQEENESWLKIFRRPIVRNIFILACLKYMCCVLVFDALVRSISQLDFDFFVSFSIISFTEFPSMALVAFAMDYTGRRWLCVVFMVLSSIFCISTAFSTGLITVVFAVAARFSVNVAFCATQQWSAEVLPTSVRGSGVAIVHICGYAAAFLSPYIVYLKVFVYWLPFTIVAVVAFIGVLIDFTLPETALRDMPQTFEEAEQLTWNQKLWTLPILESRKEKKRQIGRENSGFELDV